MTSDIPRYSNEPQWKRHMGLYQNRLRQFTDTGGQYHDLYLPKFYDKDRKTDEDHVKLETWAAPGITRPSFKDALKQAEGNWRSAKKGEQFGPSWSTHWFKIHIRVPQSWKKAERVIWNWDCSDEGMVFSEDGRALLGLSNQDRREWIIPKHWVADGEWHTFYLETSCNEMSGIGSPPNMHKYFPLRLADLVWPNLEARALHMDYWILTDAAREMPGNSWQKHRARELGNKIMDAFDPENPDESIAACRKIAAKYIGDKVDSEKVFDNDNENFVYGIGNCHIDTAWLWPFGETHRKVGRSWASQLDLLERYPEYVFAASQAQQFHWLSKDYPDLFERIKKAVKGGRFLPVGGAWVENDTNLPSGESLCRQLLLGQRFFETHFDMRSTCMWYPDSFGFSPQLPQIGRLSGLEYHMSQKISWSQINGFPHSSFMWVGLDNSQILTHFLPDNTYTAAAHYGDVKRSLENHKDLEVDRVGMLAYGYGDGGGGPTSEMIEKLRRCRGVSDTVDELPRVVLGKNATVDKFYEAIKSHTDNGKELSTWHGEMYLEYHRATYTTQAAIKKGNRYSEVLMHDVEWLATLASVSNEQYEYPTQQIDELWQDVCLNQFHDVLPGSSIEMVYQDALPLYESIFKRSHELIENALFALGVHKRADKDTKLVAVNTLPWARSELIEVDDDGGVDGMSSQAMSNGKHLVHVTADHAGIANPADAEPEDVAFAAETKPGVFTLENKRFKVNIEGGALSSVFDKVENRQVLADGKRGNQFVIFNDTPLSFPAWDTDLFSLETRKEIPDGSVSIVENGPLRAAVAVTQKISNKSTITTTISLDAVDDKHPAIGFDCDLDWHEKYKFLKVEFPVDIVASAATYETGYGAHQRPTHYNTSWEVAKFEVPGHKWADLSEHNYGVALLNDCKYGYSIHGDTIRLSLVRASKSPDAHADMGKHKFKYALMPHSGGVNSGVVRAAYNFNHPMTPHHSSTVKAVDELEVFAALTLEGTDSLVMSTVKRHEDDEDVSRGKLPVRGGKGKKNVIVRVYESLGGRGVGKLSCQFGINRAFKTNLLEDDLQEVPVSKDGKFIEFSQRPFEIATYRLELA